MVDLQEAYFNFEHFHNEPKGISAVDVVESESIKDIHPFLMIFFSRLNTLRRETTEKELKIINYISGTMQSNGKLKIKFYDLFFCKMESIFGNQFEVIQDNSYYPIFTKYQINIDQRILSVYKSISHKLLTNLFYLLDSNQEGNIELAIQLMNGYFQEIKKEELI